MPRAPKKAVSPLRTTRVRKKTAPVVKKKMGKKKKGY